MKLQSTIIGRVTPEISKKIFFSLRVKVVTVTRKHFDIVVPLSFTIFVFLVIFIEIATVRR